MQAVNRSRSIRRAFTSIGSLAALAGVLAAPAALAQSAPQGQIVIPDDVKIFGNDNPNVRRATAVVNGSVITGTDVDQRLALLVAANKGKISDEEMKRLRLQVLRNLIDETLQIQEAKASDIEVSQAEVDQSYARVAAQNFNQNTSAMDAYLKRIGSSAESLKRQIRGELSWQRLLQRNVAPFINVSEDEVNEMLDRLKAAKGTDEYRLGEIYLAAPAEARQQVYENATQIVQQLREGGSFVAYARQYSQASTAAVGGDLGWIRLAQLPGELATVAREMQPGQLVGPIEVPGGFDILYLIDKRQVLTADPRDAVLALKQISINFPKGISEAKAGEMAEQFANTIKTAKGCGDVDRVAAQAGAQVVANDQVKARDLPGPIQNAILQLSPGETLPPFGSLQDGVRILMLCGRDDPQVDNGPSFEQLQAQMEDDRINKRAQMYLRDLRRDAIIEYN
ncbi:peptidylprolyl isomerase [Novosphingobium mangrovi (ex Huang et al. 2023)]|uniref:Parvulin-like PPIase n=1 Tax=Novosphingobium mangrovi (ex Huang et al. 2023) TaxID=2976432 RepID=A0ABT2I6Q9_9SPHN|nr:peptidylprolyl isomerase [Novosphingobium mangrovi (ex Huang et al. 2023)]MCT2400490.1 peptidylprolyl isomerase [Novosphingobium mangrovi (ex Huang et al. 2023)]